MSAANGREPPKPFSKAVTIDGKTYLFELTSASHKRVKAMTGTSLPDCVADVSEVRTKEEKEKALAGFHRLMNDFDGLPLVVRAMILPDLEKNGVSEERFHELFDGTLALAGAHAITQALIDFFRQRQDPRGDLLADAVQMAIKAAEVAAAWQTKATDAMTKKMDLMQTKLEGQEGIDAAEKMIREISTKLSTTLPESLASILQTSP